MVLQAESLSGASAAERTTRERPTASQGVHAPTSTKDIEHNGNYHYYKRWLEPNRLQRKFTLDGSTFTVVRTNAYWLAQKTPTQADLDKAFADIAVTGATTVRTWGFNEVTSPSGIYYQSWSGSTPTINYGADGLQKFDQVIALAKFHGLKLIVALTNNWQDYGGMDVYIKQIANSDNHDYFYTNSNVVQAFKNYIAVWVNRYKNEPTILAWCDTVDSFWRTYLISYSPVTTLTGSLQRNPAAMVTLAPRVEPASLRPSPNGFRTLAPTSRVSIPAISVSCGSKPKQPSNVRLTFGGTVSIGDEGMGLTGDGTYPYTAYEGLDFPTNLAISSIDFGTAHLYALPWGATSDPVGWGLQWIINHYNVQKQLNKPVILEEYGINSNQYSTYQTWLSTVVSSGLAGDLIWQAGSTFSGGQTPQDGYTIYPSDSTYTLLTQHSAALKARG
ncbi:hypothetical protein FS837_005136 [Tulasnella sp. UAMH 9824]|nr:hypothetical protein FS837_005136 [Tulasnella sp. UAMH 9824]